MVDPTKVEVVMDWKQPSTVTEVKSVLGLFGYYKMLIRKFSQIALPITLITRKDCPFLWTNECEKSFVELKTRLTQAQVLVIPSIP